TVPSASTVVSDGVSASGSDALGGLVSTNSGWSVTVLHPGINVVKSGPMYAYVGDTINYTITVTNTGDCDLTGVLVFDSLLGTVYSGSLAVGASDTFTVNYTVPSGLAVISNTASASGSDVLGRVVSASSSWSVAVLYPGISVSESGPVKAHEGDTISLTITVNNTGDATITKVSVVDSLLGDVSSSFSASLAAGASESRSFSYTVPSPSGDITDTVTATYEDALQQQVTAVALWTVAILHPGITVSTTAPSYAHVGDTVTFTITLSNTGDCDLSSVFVSDSLVGTVYSGGLAVGAIDTFTESYTVPSALAVVSDSVSAGGSDALGHSVSSSSGWSMTVLHPSITVSKTGPLYAHAGDTITYIITVTNTGDCALNGVFVTDTLLGTVYTGALAVGASDTFSLNYTVPSGLPTLSNTVSASGSDVLGGLVSENASWSVTVLHPRLSVSKSGPASAHAGDTITYVITISNTGDCTLSGVLVTDGLLGTVYSGGLAVGASDTFTVNYTVPSGLTVVANTVSASGSDVLGGVVSASSGWSVTVLHPGISVVKSGSAYAHVSDTITYTITVSNTGDCTLSDGF
ncbi:MAG: CARDB domain-containing protein, partial [Candidatus Bathyarchaeia archaeon]